MRHASHCHIKNNVPRMYRRYSVKKIFKIGGFKVCRIDFKDSLLLNKSVYNCTSLPTLERIFEANSTDFEATNLEKISNNIFLFYILDVTV